MSRRTVDWWPDVGLGLAIAAFGLAEASQRYASYGGWTPYAVALGMGAGCSLYRKAPGFALLLVWLACGLQVVAGIDLMLVQLGVVVVAFGTARFGQTAVVWASGLSIPAAAGLGFVYVGSRGTAILSELGLERVALDSIGAAPLAALAAGAVGPLLVPWLIGLVLRVLAQSRANRAAQVRAEEDRAEAEEIARLRERQADLARDVHDVVGHSLAVILAQAESAQYRTDVDTEALKQTMTNIATSARASLQDVRQVLSTGEQPATAPPGGLDQLVEGVRSGGHEVRTTELGTPRPLPPELDHVSYRVLQEMLTNAIRHGRRDAPLCVERAWEDHELRLEVRNAVRVTSTGDDGRDRGQGVDGMRRRLESVGGRLVVRRETGEGGPTFTATAWVPLRTVRAARSVGPAGPVRPVRP